MPSHPTDLRGVRHVVFDLDGTLADTLPGIAASLQHALARHAPERELPELRSQIGPPLHRMLPRIWPDLGPDLCTRIIADFCQHYDTGGFRESVPFPGADAVLRRLHAAGLTLYVLSNKRGGPARDIIAALGWADIFAEIVTPDTREPAFPSKPEAGQALQTRRNLPPGTVALVGDGEDDALTAEACGFTFIHAGYGYGRRPEGELFIEKFSELERLLLMPSPLP